MFAPQELETEISPDHTVIIRLPDEVPVGTRVRVVVEAIEPESSEAAPESAQSKKSARERLAQMGRLSTAHRLPPGTQVPTKEEVEAAGKLAPGARSSEELIDEIRGER